MKTLLDHLQKEFPTAKKQTLRRMVSEGRVTVNNRRATRVQQPIGAADTVRVVGPRKIDPTRLIVPLKIIYEDADVLVVDKPAGLLTSTVPGEKRPTALALVRRYIEASDKTGRQGGRVGLIHRLDRDASGLLVFSKSHRAYDSLKTQFFKHTVERVYEAVVYGKVNPDRGTIKSHLVERADGTVRSTRRPDEKGQKAITEYEVVTSDKKRSTLRVRLHTGRKHQIRVHLSERGHPIVGDNVYGPRDQTGDHAVEGPLRLRAAKLGFLHPATGNPVTFEAY